MNVKELLSNAAIQDIVQQHDHAKGRKKQAGYNLYTISSYNSYLENFHSDIIASLLNPEGLHQQGPKFLELFISFLNEKHNLNLKPSEFNQAIVSRETGKIDIWIRDDSSNSCIIIENKINNAVDTPDQLDTYYTRADTKGYEVKAIVYLSLYGSKTAPATTQNLTHLIRNIAAYANTEADLLSGWLQPCYEAADNMDSKSFLYQYIKLINHLANKAMDTNAIENFYQFLNENSNAINTVDTIIELRNNLAAHRATKLLHHLDDFSPFKSKGLWNPDHIILYKYNYQNNGLKMDIKFGGQTNVILNFWNPDKMEEGRNVLTEILTATNTINDFDEEIGYGNNGYQKVFNLGQTYNTMHDVDQAVLVFVKQLLEGFRKLESR